MVLECDAPVPTLAAEPEPQSETIPTSEVVPEKRTSDTELEGKELAADGELIVLFPLPQESQTGGGRETEPDEVCDSRLMVVSDSVLLLSATSRGAFLTGPRTPERQVCLAANGKGC